MFSTAGARAGSALIGAPPNNQIDFYIIRGWYRSYGMYTANSSAGFMYAATKPNDNTIESKQAAVIVGMVTVLLAMAVPTIARISIRLRNNQTIFGSDDWAIMAATSLAIVYPCLQITTVINNGAGRHTWENTYEDYNQYAYNMGICQVIFYVAAGLIKVSITLFVRRLADSASEAWRIFTNIFLVTLTVYLSIALFWWIFLCSPPRARWDKWYAGSLDEPAKCGNGSIQIKVLSVTHVTQGIILLASPIFILWRIRIGLAKKIRLFVIWSVGGLSVIGGLLQQTSTTITNDNFWEYTNVLRWTTLDLTLGIIVASLPVLDSAIMGTFSSVKTKLGGSHANSHNRANDWTDLERTTKTVQAPRWYSESIEHIMKRDKDDSVKMSNLHTDEVQLAYDNNIGDHPHGGNQDENHVHFK